MSRSVTVFDKACDAVSEAEYCADTYRLPYAIITMEQYFGVVNNNEIEESDVILEIVNPMG